MSGESTQEGARKAALPQTDVPSYGLIDTLRVAKAIANELGKQPGSPLQVAAAMGIKPTTGQFRTITASSMAYGLTDAGAFAERIGLTDLGKRVVAPTEEGDDRVALLEAVMKPRVTAAFLTKYSGSKWPRADIGQNVLESMGVPRDQSERALNLIYSDAQALGLLRDINGTEFLEVATPTASVLNVSTPTAKTEPSIDLSPASAPAPVMQDAPTPTVQDNRRVFITHGKDKQIVEQIKKLLLFGEWQPIVAEEQQSTAKPVPDKVMDEMRGCFAGIVHVGSEQKLLGTDGTEHQVLNQNVLVEIGAAMALYGRRFVLLVEKGVTLPSNLQGLYEVRYEGSGLDHESTMALLEAFSNFKNA